MIDLLSKLIPFEFKRPTSLLSIIIALIITGILYKVGDLILTGAIDVVSMSLPVLKEKLLPVLLYKLQISVLTILVGLLVFVLVLFPVYRYVDRLLLKTRRRELIFQDVFRSNIGWSLNYWGTTTPSKTNRIENAKMIFEASPSEISNQAARYGAFFDLRNGIYEGNLYEVACFVSSSDNSTMGFQLWLHDTKEASSITTPGAPITPPESGKEIKLSFRATKTNALRIHLHCRGGAGKILVKYVKVYKIEKN
jgi:hypothetical protein